MGIKAMMMALYRYMYVHGGGFVLVSSNDVDKLRGGIIYINTQPKNIKTTPSTHKRA